MKKTYIISFLFLLLFVVTSCKKDFLEVQPTEVLSEQQIAEAAKNNPDVITGSMSGIYTLMFEVATGGTSRHEDFGQKAYDIYSDFLSADLALTKNSYSRYLSFTELTVTADYTTNGNYMVWRYYYRLVRAANSVISALGGNDVTPELDDNKYLMGQAKAMRAYCYFYLSQFYTPSYNPTEEILPIYTDPIQQNQPKSTTQAVFDLIISDLTDAINLLETFDRSAKHQVNKYVAEGLLAYTYAVMGGNDNYVLAKNLTTDIITNGGFSIMTQEEVVYAGDGNLGGFNSVNSPGWMWGVDITIDHGLNLRSFWGQMDRYSYSYQYYGDIKGIDKGLYDAIPANDIRKGQFSSNSESSYYLSPLGKFYDSNRVPKGTSNTTTNDYVYMRVSEMYLLNAETAAKSGDEATAKTSLKALLELRLPDVSYVDGLSGQSLLDEIYLQTRIELWGEGKSYLAMKRNHATIERGTNHLSLVGVPISYDDPRLSFLIPQNEIQNNPFID